MGKPKAPATPDYAGAAVKQGEANLNSALATNYLNQQNQVGPYGSMTYSYGSPGTFNPETGKMEGGSGQYTPDGTFIPTATVETKLSPQEQALYDQTNQISQALNSTALKGLDYADQVTKSPISDSGMPGLRGSVDPRAMEYLGGSPQFQNYIPGQRYQTDSGTKQNYATDIPGQQLRTDFGASPQYSDFSGANPNYTGVNAPTFAEGYQGSAGLQTDVNNPGQATSYDFSAAGAMPSSADFAGQRDQITEALMARMQPYIDRDRDSLRTRLANQGLGQGSEAYGADTDIFNRGVNDQRLAAVIAGSGEQQRLFNNAMGIRQQGVGEAQAQGNFGNAAKQNMFSMGLASGEFGNSARQQELLNRNGALDATNRTRGMQFDANMSSAGLANQNEANRLNDSLRTTGFNNDVQSRGFVDNMAKIAAENAARTGQFSMDTANAEFGNAARGMQTNEDLARMQAENAARGQQFGTDAARAELYNSATGAQSADEMSRTQTNNQSRQNEFNQGLASGQFANQARSQAIQEQDYFRNAPINLINALRSGNQMNMPQFQNWAAGSQIGAAPVYAAVNDQYNAQLKAYEQKMAGFAATIGGISKLGSAFIPVPGAGAAPKGP